MNIYDTKPDALVKSLIRIKTWMDLLERKGLLVAKRLPQSAGHVRTASSLTDALKDADYVQESVPEDLELKKQVFRQVDSLTGPSTIIASSTSGLSMTEIQKVVQKPERCITVHPVNPPHLIPLVEIVPGRQTAEDVVKTVYDFMLKLKKMPIVVRKEVPGFVFNRLSAALWREALDLLNKDVATVEDIDKVASAGMGLRLAIMGPFLTYHLGGGEGGLEYFIEHLRVFSEIWESMDTWNFIPNSAVKKAVDGVRQMDVVKTKTYDELVRWRDDKLITLIELLFDSISTI